jgi:hypothetical protein
LNVVTYRDVKDQEPIMLDSNDSKPTLWSLPAWSLPRVQGDIDYAFNAFSFQEMEHPTCLNYAREVMRLTRRGVQLHSRTGGHKLKAGGQERPITMDDLREMLKPAFPNSLVIGDLWAKATQRPSSEAELLSP